MEETKKKVEELGKIKKQLCSWLCSEMEKGRNQVDAKEAGEVVDMIKDLADAEEKCWKACYYKKIVEAMHEEKESEEQFLKMMKEGMGEEGEGRMGYDNYRYPSSGRFASKGHGIRMGYLPGVRMPGVEPWKNMMDSDDYVEDYMNPRMGYTGSGGSSGGSSGGGRGGNSGSSSGGRGNSSSSSGGSSGRGGSSSGGNSGNNSGGSSNGRYGYSYEQYRDRRRNYSESHNEKDKEEMDAHAMEHMADTITSMRDIWQHADPGMKSRMKTDLSNLIGEMNS